MTPTLQHIIFIDLLPIVTFGLIGYIYHRMKVTKLERENKSLSSDVDFWHGYSERTAEAYDRIFAAYEKLKAVKPENPPSNATPYNLDLESVEKAMKENRGHMFDAFRYSISKSIEEGLIPTPSAVSKDDIESGSDYIYRVPFDHNAEWDANILRKAEEQRAPDYVPGQPFQPPMPWTDDPNQNSDNINGETE
jgi:hypothetical protein